MLKDIIVITVSASVFMRITAPIYLALKAGTQCLEANVDIKYHQNKHAHRKTKDYLLDLSKTNDILCLTTTETSEPAANVRRTSWGYAPLFGIHEHWVPGDRVELSLMSPKSAKHIFKQALFL